MALDLIIIAVGSFLVSSAFAYAWWASIRVTFLREELFAIRDRLWDVARERGRLTDAAHIQARRHLNAIIRTAGLYSVPTLNVMVRRGRNLPSEDRMATCDNVLGKAIDEAYGASWELLTRYIFFQHASGWVAIVRLLSWHFLNRRRPIRSIVNARPQRREESKWVNSSRPELLSEVDDEARGCGVLVH